MIVNFGKYKGKPLSELTADKDYYRWCEKAGLLKRSNYIVPKKKERGKKKKKELKLVRLGGIKKATKEYVYPSEANKIDEYICPDCKKQIILCKGTQKRPYYRHTIEEKGERECRYYENPSESQIHKDGKLKLKKILESGRELLIKRECGLCHNRERIETPILKKGQIELEYRFKYNGIKIADIAHIEEDEIKCIYEICNTHRTGNNDRPELGNSNEISFVQHPP